MSGNTQKLEQELEFVRGAVERRDQQQYASVAIALLWAVILGVGFILNDFALQAAQWYWPIAPLLGFFTSGWISYRGELMAGVSSRDGWKHGLHWGSIFIVSVAVLSIAISNRIDGEAVGQLFTLVAGTVYFLGGVHLDRRFLLPGILLVVGAAAIDYLQPFAWTIVGLATAASLIASALWMKPKNDQAVTTS